LLHQVGSRGLVAGGAAQLVDLRVAVIEDPRGGRAKGGDRQALEVVEQAAVVVGGHDQVGLVGGDGLHVRIEGTELRRRHAGRVVRRVVDGDDLLSGAYG